ncbi:MAG: hypothetical protein V1745_02125 [Patescibacteria group bacterium]
MDKTNADDDFLRISVQQQAFDAFAARPVGLMDVASAMAMLDGLMWSRYKVRTDLVAPSDILELSDAHAALFLALVRGTAPALHIPRDPGLAARLVAADDAARRYPR